MSAINSRRFIGSPRRQAEDLTRVKLGATAWQVRMLRAVTKETIILQSRALRQAPTDNAVAACCLERSYSARRTGGSLWSAPDHRHVIVVFDITPALLITGNRVQLELAMAEA